jgi:uncharacterized RDD family membrane protein YckC
MSDLGRLDETIDSGPRQVVRSPEQVALHFPVAGPTSRILAYGIDVLVIVTIEIAAFVALLASAPVAGALAERLRAALGSPTEPVQEVSAFFALAAFFLLFQLAVEMTYFVLIETTTGGRSVGKRVVGLRVVRDGGLPIGLRESLVRNLLRSADALPANYVVGLVAMLLSREGKRLGDLAAGTIVIRLDRPAAAPPLPAWAEGEGGEAFRFERGHVASLGAEGRALVRQTLRRLDELPPGAREAALERSVEALRARLGYAPVAPERRRAFLLALLEAARMR